MKITPKVAKAIGNNSFGTSSRKGLSLLGWGSNFHSQLPTETSSRTLKTQQPTLLSFCNIRNVACGWAFSLTHVETKDSSKVFGCGLNSHGQLGRQSFSNDYKIETLREIRLPELEDAKYSIKQIACGRTHSIVSIMTASGVYKTFAFGDNCYGQCGQPLTQKQLNFPTEIESLRDQRIIKLECGLDTSYALTAEGRVYSWGWNADGQTGRNGIDWSPDLISLPKVTEISSNGDCCLVLTEDGQVFGWGNNEYRQTMTSSTDPSVLYPKSSIFHEHNGHDIKSVASCSTFGMILTESGSLHLIGNTPSGKHCETLKEKYSSVFGGLEYGLSIQEQNGHVFGFGTNSWGCISSLGHHFTLPENIVKLNGKMFEKVSLGPQHALAIIIDGES